MNKLVKGSIAGAAGVLLLLGGAGTFALWNENVTAQGGTVTTGNLDLALVADTAAWADISPDADGAAFDPTADAIVPGDTITFTQNFTVTAWGKNLRAEVGLDPASYSIAAAVADDVSVTLSVSSVGDSTDATITPVDATTYAIDPGVDIAPGAVMTFSALVTITFDGDETTGANDSAGESVADAVALDDLAFFLNQVRP